MDSGLQTLFAGALGAALLKAIELGFNWLAHYQDTEDKKAERALANKQKSEEREFVTQKEVRDYFQRRAEELEQKNERQRQEFEAKIARLTEDLEECKRRAFEDFREYTKKLDAMERDLQELRRQTGFRNAATERAGLE